MNRILFILAFAMLAVSCKHQLVSTPEENITPAAEQEAETEVEAVNSPAPDTGLAADSIVYSKSAGKLRTDMQMLASDRMEGRKTGTAGFDAAADYVIGELKKYGLKPYYNTYKAPLEGYEVEAYNVIAQIPGTHPEHKDEWIVIGAHLDHIGTAQEVNGDRIANGANDNAAGSIVILELARRLARVRRGNARSIMFVWFTAEESGLVGSRYLAKKLKGEGFNPYVMLNYEMLGVPMEGKDHKVYLTGYEKSNMAEVVNDYAGKKLVGFLPKAQEYQLFMRSDNLGFFQEFNIPAQTFSSFDFTNYAYYHHVDDEPKYIDYEFMSEVVADFVPVVTRLANTDGKVVILKPE